MTEFGTDDPPAEPTFGKPARKKKKKASKKKAAKKLADAILKKEQEKRDRAALGGISPDEKTVWYMACPDRHPGIFFKGKPDGRLGINDWFSGYKELEQDWPMSPESITCQVCKQKMRMWHTRDGALIANPRFVRKMPRKQFEQYMEEAEA